MIKSCITNIFAQVSYAHTMELSFGNMNYVNSLNVRKHIGYLLRNNVVQLLVVDAMSGK